MTAQTLPNLTNWTVYYDEATTGGGYKQIKWTGTTGGTNSINDLYSELMHLFNDPSNQTPVAANGTTTPMRAVTPTLYEIGSFDPGDDEPWFIDPESTKHLIGGGLNSVSWERVTGSNTGIVVIGVTVTVNWVTTDIGRTVTDGTSSGRLLHFDNSAGLLWIRPNDNTATHDWSGTASVSTTSGTGAASAHTSAQSNEYIWSNIFTIGTLAANSLVYVGQNESVLANSVTLPNTNIVDWWSEGQIDILVPTTDYTGLIDDGYLTIYARQYSKLYDNFVSDVSGGGRTAIPLSTSNDLNNTTGYKQVTLSGSSGTWNVGSGIYVGGTWATATAQGVITNVSGNDIQYYLIGDLTDLSNTTLTEYVFSTGADGDASATGISAGPTNVNIAAFTTADVEISYLLGGYAADVNNDTTNEDYSIQVDLKGSTTLDDWYEYSKYITRRGSTTSLNGIEGQQYIGVDTRLDFTTLSASATLGDQVRGATSNATGIVVHEETNYVMLMNTQGTFVAGENITSDNGVTTRYTSVTDVESIPASKQAPFGTFAGGRFFGASGVYLANVPAADANNYELLDDTGATITPPQSVAFTLTGVAIGSEVKIINNDLTTTRDTVIYGEETTSTSTVSFTYTYNAPNITYTSNLSGNSYTLTSPISATVIVFDYDYKEVRLDVSLDDTSQSIPIQQITERNYSGSF